MTGDSAPIEYPDEAGYPDGVGTLTEEQQSQAAEVASTVDVDRPSAAVGFYVVRNDDEGKYSAIIGDEEVGVILFEQFGKRIALEHTRVPAEYDGLGIATELIWRVLDDIATRGETVTVICPLVKAFIAVHPAFAAVVDPIHPGTDR